MKNSPISHPHDYWMRHALDLARRGRYSAAPNPCVGCVIVQDGRLLGAGFHARTGEAHAEIHALQIAGDAARGATAYVTLEPCAHYGRTPPCADALIAAGIGEVVIACTDPNPLIAGQGIAKLHAAGINTLVGVLENEALQLNRAFFHRMKTGRPFLTLKLAASIDGRTALANGESQWITCAAAQEDVHRRRLRADAVIAGTGSVITDNARLSARHHTVLPANQPLRVVIDSRLKTPADAAVFKEPGQVLLATTTSARPSYPANSEILQLPPTTAGKVPLNALLNELGRREINHAFIEAGAALGGAVLDQRLADEILLYLAPTFLGGDARPLVTTAPLSALSDKMRYRIADSRPIGEDWRFTLVP